MSSAGAWESLCSPATLHPHRGCLKPESSTVHSESTSNPALPFPLQGEFSEVLPLKEANTILTAWPAACSWPLTAPCPKMRPPSPSNCHAATRSAHHMPGPGSSTHWHEARQIHAPPTCTGQCFHAKCPCPPSSVNLVC